MYQMCNWIERGEDKMPIAWRKDLGYWMNQKTQEAGVELWDNAGVTDIIEVRDGYVVTPDLGKKNRR